MADPITLGPVSRKCLEENCSLLSLVLALFSDFNCGHLTLKQAARAFIAMKRRFI